MLKFVFGSVINRLLGQYIENIDKNLEVGLWSGNITLKDVRIKHDALILLNIPLKVISGTIKTLSIQIPWSSFKKAPVMLTASGIRICVQASDTGADNEKEQRQKQEWLDLYEQTISSADAWEQMRTEKKGLVEQTVESIIKSMQVAVTDIVLEFKHNEQMLRGRLGRVGVNTNTQCQGINKTATLEGIAMEIIQNVDEKTVFSSGDVLLFLAKEKEMLTLSGSVDRITGALTKTQYSGLIEMVHDLFHVGKKEEPGDFPAALLLQRIRARKRWTWEYIKEKCLQRREYFRVYGEWLDGRKAGDALTCLEVGMTYEKIVLYRSLVRRERKRRQTWKDWLLRRKNDSREFNKYVSQLEASIDYHPLESRGLAIDIKLVLNELVFCLGETRLVLTLISFFLKKDKQRSALLTFGKIVASHAERQILKIGEEGQNALDIAETEPFPLHIHRRVDLGPLSARLFPSLFVFFSQKADITRLQKLLSCGRHSKTRAKPTAEFTSSELSIQYYAAFSLRLCIAEILFKDGLVSVRGLQVEHVRGDSTAVIIEKTHVQGCYLKKKCSIELSHLTLMLKKEALFDICSLLRSIPVAKNNEKASGVFELVATNTMLVLESNTLFADITTMNMADDSLVLSTSISCQSVLGRPLGVAVISDLLHKTSTIDLEDCDAEVTDGLIQDVKIILDVLSKGSAAPEELRRRASVIIRGARAYAQSEDAKVSVHLATIECTFEPSHVALSLKGTVYSSHAFVCDLGLDISAEAGHIVLATKEAPKLSLDGASIESFLRLLVRRADNILKILAEGKTDPPAEICVIFKSAALQIDAVQIKTDCIRIWLFEGGRIHATCTGLSAIDEGICVLRPHGTETRFIYSQAPPNARLFVSGFTVDAVLFRRLGLLYSILRAVKMPLGDKAPLVFNSHLSRIKVTLNTLTGIELDISNAFFTAKEIQLSGIKEKTKTNTFSILCRKKGGCLSVLCDDIVASFFVDDLVAIRALQASIHLEHPEEAVTEENTLVLNPFKATISIIDRPARGLPFIRAYLVFLEKNIFSCSVEHFNICTAVWEPLLEKTDGVIEIRSGATPMTSIKMLSTPNIVLSYRFIERLLHVQRHFHESEESTFGDVFVINLAGRTLQIKANNIFTVESGGEAAVPTLQINAEAMLAFEGGWEAGPLCLSHEEQFPVTLLHKIKPAKTVLCTVEMERERKRVFFEAETLFSNKTCMDVDVEVVFSDKKTLLLSLGPGKRGAVPFDCAHVEKIRLKPSSSTSWPSKKINFARLRKKGMATPVCREEIRRLYYCLMHIQDVVSTVQITPPLRIRNGLWHDIELVMVDRQEKTLSRCSVPAGGATDVHTLDPGCEIDAMVEIGALGAVTAQKSAFLNRRRHGEGEMTVFDEDGVAGVVFFTRRPGMEAMVEISLFTKYALLNNTGRFLFVMDSLGPCLGTARRMQTFVAGRKDAYSFSLFRTTAKSIFIKHENTEWSAAIDVSTAGSSKKVELAGLDRDCTLAVEVNAGTGPYERTNIITVSKRYFLANKTALPITLQWARAGGDKRSAVAAPDEVVSLDIVDASLSAVHILLGKASSQEADLTAAGSHFVMVGDVLVKCKTAFDGPRVFFVLKIPCNGWMPLAVANGTSHNVQFFQKGGVKRFHAASQSTTGFYWENPKGERKVVVHIAGAEGVVDLKKIGLAVKMRFGRECIEAVVFVSDNVFVVRLISQQQLLLAKKRKQTPATNKIIFTAPALGVSLIEKNKQCLLVFFLRDVTLETTLHDSEQQLRLVVGWLSLEDGSHKPMFPFILKNSKYFPRQKCKQRFDGIREELSVVLDNRPRLSDCLKMAPAILLYFRLEQAEESPIITLSAQLEALSLFMDVSVLERVFNFWLVFTSTEKETQIAEEPSFLEEKAFYFRLFEISGFTLTGTVGSAEEAPKNEKGRIAGLRRIIDTVGTINSLPIAFRPMLLSEQLLERDLFAVYAGEFYLQQVKRKLFSAVGSAEFIGDPAGLFRNIYEGVRGFQGGFFSGGRGIVKKTISGLSASIESITKSLGRGLAKTTFDKNFRRKREERKRNMENKLLFGVTQLAVSLGSAIAGIWQQPMRETRAHGPRGIISGTAKALGGLVTKPAIGLFDSVYGVSAEVRRHLKEKVPEPERSRLPRHTVPSGAIEAYSPVKAIGQALLFLCISGKAPVHFYTSHIFLHEEDAFLLSSTRAFFLIARESLSVLWSARREDIRLAVLSEDLVTIYLHDEGRRIFRRTCLLSAWMEANGLRGAV
eukprot:GHVN01054473.1.p1 GENE.GHVN01054473.1~~GHVN01054473.1.p1  ORF type:complete len:2255 (-),score=166.66 GHVN01054473.1:628-7392(-)